MTNVLIYKNSSLQDENHLKYFFFFFFFHLLNLAIFNEILYLKLVNFSLDVQHRQLRKFTSTFNLYLLQAEEINSAR